MTKRVVESIEERLAHARAFFLAQAEAARKSEKHETYEHLCRLVESVQETARQLDYLKAQMEEFRHGLSLR